MDARSLLRRIPLFAELDEAVLTRLAERCVTRTYPPASLLFTTGEQCRGLYVVQSGTVRVFRTSPEGREQVLHVEGPGRPVAELPLFDGGAYPASAMTVEESRLVFLPRAEFEALYRADADVAQAVVRALGRRLRHLVHLTETLAFRDVAARLALLLAEYAERGGRATAEGTEITLDRTRTQLSLEIGTARESVSRAFKQLERKGVIRVVGRHRIIVPDVAKLRTLGRPGERAHYD